MIDSHAHLEMPEFDADREEVLARARKSGVSPILSLGLLDAADSHLRALELVASHPDLYTAVGCHPHDAKGFGAEGEQGLRELAGRERVVAVGEIGLDYHYNLSPPEVQRDVFRRQLRLARELALPAIIHHREAESDLIAILDEEGPFPAAGVLHSFTASRELARAALDRGFFISFSGILTFKNAASLRETARELPRERLLVETDAPYLAPVPHRGKRNEPAFVWETARVLAELQGLLPRELEAATDENFRRLFGL